LRKQNSHTALKRTILKCDEQKLEALHMSCQRRILIIRWFHRVTNAEVTSHWHETLPSTAAVRGRYDPSWSSVTDDDDDDAVK